MFRHAFTRFYLLPRIEHPSKIEYCYFASRLGTISFKTYQCKRTLIYAYILICIVHTTYTYARAHTCTSCGHVVWKRRNERQKVVLRFSLPLHCTVYAIICKNRSVDKWRRSVCRHCVIYHSDLCIFELILRFDSTRPV